MRCSTYLLALGMITVCLGGCDSAGAKRDGSGDTTAAPKANTPGEAVAAFLGAVRGRQDAKARLLLTTVARQKTAKMELVQDLHVSEAASFQIGEVEQVADGAQVACTWSDVDEDGEKYSTTLVWLVRREDAGWRIMGMATRVFDDRPPVILNYEDPADMKRQQLEVEQEMARREAAHQARQTERPQRGTGKTSR